jgi:type I restriction enzyme S subunit
MSTIPAGYKQTEVGVIPEDWSCKTVDQLVQDSILAKPLDGNHGNIHPKSGDFVSHGIPFIMANNVRDGCIDLTNCVFIRKEQADSLQKGFSMPGDVLLTHKATIGQTAIVGDVPYEYIMLTPQVTYYRIIDGERLNNEYLRQYFEGANFQRVLQSLSGGGTRSYIGITAQRELPVVVPRSVLEQRAIAAALSDVDALLAKLDQLIAKKLDLKQAAMQQLLTGQTRLPGFCGTWKTSTLGQVIQRFSTGLNPRDNFKLNTGGEFFYVTIKNFAGGRLFLDEKCDSIDQAAFMVINARSDLRRDDILFSSIGRVGDAYLIRETPHNWNINESVFTLRPDQSQVVPLMLFYLLTSNSIRDALDQGVTGSTFMSIKQADLKAIPCVIPISLEEQTAIATVLSDMDADITALEARRNKTRDLKQGMMQELLTGRIRLV